MNLQHWVFLLFLITYVDNSIISFFKTNIKVKTENIHFMYSHNIQLFLAVT